MDDPTHLVPSGAPGPKLEPHFLAPDHLVFARHPGTTMEFLLRDGSPGTEAYPKCSAAVQFNFFETAIFA